MKWDGEEVKIFGEKIYISGTDIVMQKIGGTLVGTLVVQARLPQQGYMFRLAALMSSVAYGEGAELTLTERLYALYKIWRQNNLEG